MIKQVVHIEDIERNGIKKQFQIKLPYNAKKILAIKITANPFDRSRKSNSNSEIGWLWLRLPEARDVFYAHRINTYKDGYNLTLPKVNEVNSIGGSQYSQHGTKEEFKSLTAELNTNIIEGYYVDRIYDQRSMYQLRIYLKLEL